MATQAKRTRTRTDSSASELIEKLDERMATLAERAQKAKKGSESQLMREMLNEDLAQLDTVRKYIARAGDLTDAIERTTAVVELRTKLGLDKPPEPGTRSHDTQSIAAKG